MIHTAAEVGYEARVVASVEEVNKAQKWVLFEKLQPFCPSAKWPYLCQWGLAFKPNTDDMREAPSRTLIELLIANGATVRPYDPEANEEAPAHLRR